MPAVGTHIQERSARTQIRPVQQPSTPRCNGGKCDLPKVVASGITHVRCPFCGWLFKLNRTVMMWYVA